MPSLSPIPILSRCLTSNHRILTQPHRPLTTSKWILSPRKRNALIFQCRTISTKTKTKNGSRTLLTRPLHLLLWTPLLIFLSDHLLTLHFVKGPSMSPTLSPHYKTHGHRDLVLVYKWNILSDPSSQDQHHHPSHPNISLSLLPSQSSQKKTILPRGSIIVFRSPQNPEILLVKRIIGLPGDIIQPRPIRNYKDEKSEGIMSGMFYPPPVQVPQGHLWVEGDEGFQSRDSNYYGPIARGLVVGKVTHILWPLSRAGRVDDWKGVSGPKYEGDGDGGVGGRKNAVLART